MEEENRLPEKTRNYYYGLEEHLESLPQQSRLCEKLHASWMALPVPLPSFCTVTA